MPETPTQKHKTTAMRTPLSREARLQISVAKLQAGNDALRAEVALLKQTLKDKDKQIAELMEQLKDKESQRKELLSYLYTPNKDNSASPKPKGGRKEGIAFHRPIPKDSDVTDERTFSIKQCPLCKHAVGKAVDTVIKYEEDIDLIPKKIVRKYTITRHWCPHCETFVKAHHMPPIQRIGLNVLGYILYARYRLRMPMAKIKESLSDLHNFEISEGEIAEKLKESESLFGKEHQAIIELIKQAKAVHADETGWRMDGRNWWLWVFTTEQGTRYVIEDSRGKGVAQEALGSKEDRVVISDGYAAYQNLSGDKQQCWVHLLRAAKGTSPSLYDGLAQLYQKLVQELEKPISDRDPPWFAEQLQALAHNAYPEPEAIKTQQRIIKHQEPLLTCLRYDHVLPENNPAERAIRPQVVMRKIFGGSRSLAGAKAHEVNSSVIETLMKRNPNTPFFEVVLPVLQKNRSEL